MSIKLMTLVWESDHLKGSELLALLALSDFANDDGYCWPSANRLGKKIRLSERQAQRVLNSLEAQGFIETVNQGGIGARDSNTYRVIIAKLTEKKYDISGELTKMKYDTQRDKYDTQRAISTTSSAQRLYIEPSLEPSLEPSAKTQARGDIHSEISFEDCKPEPKASRVLAVRHSGETITFDNPPALPTLKPNTSPLIAPPPPRLVVGAESAEVEGNAAQDVFASYFPGRKLSVIQMKSIAETVSDTQRWIRVCDRWAEVYGDDWRKFGLLDWYREGIPGEDRKRGVQNGKHSKPIAGNSGNDGVENAYPEYAEYQ